VPRKDFGLADLFAVTWSGCLEGPVLNSSLRREHDTVPNHPLFKGLEDAPRIVNGVSRVVVAPREKFAQVPITLIQVIPICPWRRYIRACQSPMSQACICGNMVYRVARRLVASPTFPWI
jgi:hypothetical protein